MLEKPPYTELDRTLVAYFNSHSENLISLPLTHQKQEDFQADLDIGKMGIALAPPKIIFEL